MKKRNHRLIQAGIVSFIFSLSALYSSCKRDNPDPIPNTQSESQPPASAPTLTEIQNEIFSPSCAISGCHDAATAQSGLRLTSGNSFSQIVNVNSVRVPSLKRVATGGGDTAVSSSFLINKMENTQGSVGDATGQVMPTSGKLSQDKIDKVKAWIRAGAQNN